ncbi:hypothetical protein [Estrella lausannensis]|uniref:Uncharacterized protein n=1 Tax=Estrella lausannensis TaxID=483423 RepID=A0A0H5DQP3_9BACT|nr:hypothetical protein [Estrella lausannensis]CRX38418.1 Conserved hypothetical protein [Estrella lausannensis]
MAKKSVGRSQEDVEGDKGGDVRASMEALINAMLHQLEEQYFNEVEPFESYSKRLRLKLYRDLEGYCERFQKGYEVISAEMKNS